MSARSLFAAGDVPTYSLPAAASGADDGKMMVYNSATLGVVFATPAPPVPQVPSVVEIVGAYTPVTSVVALGTSGVLDANPTFFATAQEISAARFLVSVWLTDFRMDIDAVTGFLVTLPLGAKYVPITGQPCGTALIACDSGADANTLSAEIGAAGNDTTIKFERPIAVAFADGFADVWGGVYQYIAGL